MQHNKDEKYIYYDSSNVKHEIEIVDGDFKLAKVDKKIHDTKFKTKPTTFAKDAFKRFCKNKSSVAGAIIVGLLLLCAVFVPIIDQSDVDTVHPEERLLEPKLFNAGTGFWDGTKKVTNIVCDTTSVAFTQDGVTYYYPFEESYSASAIILSSLTAPVQSTVNTAGNGVTGGYVRITNSNQVLVEEDDEEDDESIYETNKITYSSYSYDYDKDETYGLEIVFTDEEIDDLALGTYSIYLSYSISTNGVSGATTTTTLTSFEAADDEEGEYDNDYPFAGTWTGTIGSYTSATLELNNDQTGSFNGTEFEYAVTTNDSYYDGGTGTTYLEYTITAESSDNSFEFTIVYDEYYSPNELIVTYTERTTYTYYLTGTQSDPYIDTYEAYSNDDILSGIVDSLAADQEIDSMSICIDLLPGYQVNTYLLIESVEVTTSSTDSDEQDTINSIGYGYSGAEISDANASLLLSSSDVGYWRCTGTKNLYKGTAYTCNFTYDTYQAVYGEMTETVPVTTIETYAENGWLSDIILEDDWSWDDWVTSNSSTLSQLYELLKTDLTEDYCPIISFSRISRGSAGGVTYYTIRCYVSKYKLLGYTSMPRYLLGTDSYGRDLLKVTFVGLRNSFLIAVGVALFCFLFGLIWGSISGYFGGNVDLIMERISDFLNGVPYIVVVTLCVLNMGTNFGVFLLAMCIIGWIGTAARTRTQFYRFRDREYTLASRTLGASNTRLIFKHILPNAMGTIITGSVLMIPSVIFSEATVSYLGLGFTDIISLGVTLSNNQQYLSTYPYLIIFPSVIMALLMISFNLLGNGLRDAFNPSLKGSE